MWLVDAAKSARANASGYVASVQQKASDIVATVQDEANHVLKAMAYPVISPIDEPLYEELDAYNEFKQGFDLRSKTEEIAQILQEDKDLAALHEQVVPVSLTYEEFWLRVFFRRKDDEIDRQAPISAPREKAIAQQASVEGGTRSKESELPSHGSVMSIERLRQLEAHVTSGLHIDAFDAENTETKQLVSLIKNIAWRIGEEKAKEISAAHDEEILLWKSRALKMKAAKKEADEKAEGYLAELSALQREATTTSAAAAAAAAESSEPERMSKMEEYRAKLEHAQKSLEARDRHVSELSKHILNLEEQQKARQEREERLNAENQQLTASIERLQREHGMAIRALEETSSHEIEQLKSQLDTLELSNKNREAKVTSMATAPTASALDHDEASGDVAAHAGTGRRQRASSREDDWGEWE